MNSTRFIFALSLAATCMLPSLHAQTVFDVEAYERFLRETEDISSERLQSLHPAGIFADSIGNDFDGASFADSIDHYYSLTDYERSLIRRHGFMVTERVRYERFCDAFLEIYNRDLPVFISTDAMLHALHMSYDRIMEFMEVSTLSPYLQSLLTAMHDRLPQTAERYSADRRMDPMLSDIDLYLTVARWLLCGGYECAEPKYLQNLQIARTIMTNVENERPVRHPLFGTTPRTIDYSQFTPRGHYDTDVTDLRHYFKAMVWLGRIEFYLTIPESSSPQATAEDVRRQVIDAALLIELSDDPAIRTLRQKIDRTIAQIVGESDNTSIEQMGALLQAANVESADQLLADASLARFHSVLASSGFSGQRINSQILGHDPMSPRGIVPASAVMMFGQRFAVDAFVMGSVVFDKIRYKGEPIRRMLPSTLDVLFALGNDASAQLLTEELDRYHYADHLAALRHLVDSYEPEYWDGTLYNGWLQAIRTLAPPRRRDSLPAYMRTAAWWQQKLNTQLAAWSQLRHNNILYLKPSYSGGQGCSFPTSHVEPIPAFYDALGRYARHAATTFKSVGGTDNVMIVRYFERFAVIADTLGAIARKELARERLTAEEELFLRSMLTVGQKHVGCITIKGFNGWYADLYFSPFDGGENSALTAFDKVVADVHTAPTDAMGTPTGWVLHGGTGPIDLAVVTCRMPDGGTSAFVGPVMSYYEHVSTNYKRLTDGEWKNGAYAQAPSFRPPLVNLYLADSTGNSRGEAQSLRTSKPSSPPLVDGIIDIDLVAPNPSSSTTVIGFSIPPSLANQRVKVVVTDALGREVTRLLDETLPSGGYAVEWDGAEANGVSVSEGVYFVSIAAGSAQATAKVNRIR